MNAIAYLGRGFNWNDLGQSLFTDFFFLLTRWLLKSWTLPRHTFQWTFNKWGYVASWSCYLSYREIVTRYRKRILSVEAWCASIHGPQGHRSVRKTQKMKSLNNEILDIQAVFSVAKRFIAFAISVSCWAVCVFLFLWEERSTTDSVYDITGGTRVAAAIRSVSVEVCWMQEFSLPNGRDTLIWSFYDQRVKTAPTVFVYVQEIENSTPGVPNKHLTDVGTVFASYFSPNFLSNLKLNTRKCSMTLNCV
jgi:hypothetical protein